MALACVSSAIDQKPEVLIDRSQGCLTQLEKVGGLCFACSHSFFNKPLPSFPALPHDTVLHDTVKHASPFGLHVLNCLQIPWYIVV